MLLGDSVVKKSEVVKEGIETPVKVSTRRKKWIWPSDEEIKEMNKLSKIMKGKTTPKKKVLKTTTKTDKKVLKKPVKPKKKFLSDKTISYERLLEPNAIALEIKKNKDCYPMMLWETATIFIKKVSTSSTKINDNSVFQPHEKKEDKIYCVIGIFEYNSSLPNYVHERYQPYIDRGAKVYYISRVSEIEDILKGIE
jgi:hypothetical protein